MNVRISQLIAFLIAGLWTSGHPAFAQDPGAIGGYTLGFVFDGRSSGLRPLVGIPGAAVLGAKLETGVAIRQAYLSPRQNYAVALTENGTVLVSMSSTAAPAIAPLGLDASAEGVVALSPDGSAGAFYNVSDAVIRIVTGLPAAPNVVRSVPVAAISGAIRLLAISNDAAQLVAAVDTTGANTLTQIDADGNGRTLANSTHISALQFIGDSKDVLVADDADDTISVVQDVSASAVWRPLAGAGEGVAGPVSVDVSLDGKLVIVANGRARNIFVFDPNGSQRATYACPCTPAELGRLNGNSVFLLTDVSGTGPLWIFDGDSATPRVVFVPPGESGSTGAAQ